MGNADSYNPHILGNGDRFSFETKGGRTGLGTVVAIEEWRHSPYKVQWWDHTGKHYEWFGLHEFKYIIKL